MSEPRTESRRLVVLGPLIAAGMLVVVLGAEVTPGGHHGHPRYVPPHTDAPGPRPTELASHRLAQAVPVVLGAPVIITISYAIPRFASSAVVELAGLIGVLVVAPIPAWLILHGGVIE